MAATAPRLPDQPPPALSEPDPLVGLSEGSILLIPLSRLGEGGRGGEDGRGALRAPSHLAPALSAIKRQF